MSQPPSITHWLTRMLWNWHTIILQPNSWPARAKVWPHSRPFVGKQQGSSGTELRFCENTIPKEILFQGVRTFARPVLCQPERVQRTSSCEYLLFSGSTSHGQQEVIFAFAMLVCNFASKQFAHQKWHFFWSISTTFCSWRNDFKWNLFGWVHFHFCIMFQASGMICIKFFDYCVGSI